jgi:hypothetical protein
MPSPLNSLVQEFYSLREDAGQSLKQQLIQFLARNAQEITALRWTQWTPYFNDGETCSFSVCQWSVEFLFTNQKTFGTQENFAQEVVGLLYSVHEEVPLHLFGDHAQITLQGEEFTVKPYTKHD